MKNLLRAYCNINKAQIFTALVLTGILSVFSGLSLIKSTNAVTVNALPETTNEVNKQNLKLNRFPRVVANAVLRNILENEQVSANKLQIIEYNQQTWRNGCLELPQANELCTQALVPGWRVVASDGEQKWIYHTNNNGRSLRLAVASNSQITPLKPVQIPANQLPVPLDRNVLFRQISSGGLTGRTYETVLLKDGRMIRVRIGDANDSERSVRRISLQQVQQFQQLLERSRFRQFVGLSYPAPNIAADHITHTLTSPQGTVQYNDISQNNLPQSLQAVVKGWNRISKSQL
ncbi:hypothetical protein [Fortiea contorta]|uniref:hypothetical protein n=1 Tax=Fortiea contorta TaxID=1892405 RepID=UPI00034521E9|nr:hypothetical protein [Fortiea contorta]